MSKKQKALEAELAQENSDAQDDISQGVVVTTDKKTKTKEKDKSKDKDKKDKNKKKKKEKKERKGFGRRVKETASELKKVTWPTFGEVCKKTGIVIAFVLIFGLALYGVNYLLGGLVNLLINGKWL